MDYAECFYKINQLPRNLAVLLSIFLDKSLISRANRRGQAGCYQHTITCIVAAGPVVLKEPCNVIDANGKIITLQLKSEIAK